MMTTRRSRLALDRALLEGATDLAPEEEARVVRWAELDRRFLELHPNPSSLAGAVRSERSPLRWVLSLCAAAAVFCAGAFMLPSAFGPHASTRIKGASSVELWVEAEGAPARFSGQRLKEGDTLVFRYTTSKSYMALFSVEASGKSNVYEVGPIERGQNRVVPNGVKLDGYPGPERVFFLLSDAPLDEETLAETLKARLSKLDQKALDLGPIAQDVEQSSWLIEKEGGTR